MMRNAAGSGWGGVSTMASRVTVLLLLLAGAGACGDGRDQSLPEDLTRDLSLAAEASTAPALERFGGDTAASGEVGSPTLAPTPAPVATASGPETAPRPAARPAPSAAAPTPSPAPAPAATPVPDVSATAPAPTAGDASAGDAPAGDAPAVRRTLLAAGTTLAGTTGARLCTTTNRPGDRVVMRLTAPVTGPDGAVLPAGTAVLLEVLRADSLLELRVRSVQVDGELLPLVATTAVDTPIEDATTGGGVDKKKVIGGAIAGAIIGQVLGKEIGRAHV